MLDKSKPYTVVSGKPGVGYEQNGMLFKPNGEFSELTYEDMSQGEINQRKIEMLWGKNNE